MKINLSHSLKGKERYPVLLGILSLTFLAYKDVLSHQFQTLWDDQWVAVNIFTEVGITLDNFKDILLTFYKGQYAPVNQLYYSALHNLFTYSPRAFHMAGLLVHLANILLVYTFIKSLLSTTKINNDRDSQKIAVITSLLFAIHPINVESVAWIAASKVLLYGFFYLFGLISYLEFLKKRQWSFYALAGLMFVLSFLSKEQAVTFPISIVLLDLLYFKFKVPASYWIQKLPFLMLSLLFGYITILSQSVNGEGVMTESVQYNLLQRICFGSYALLEYCLKCLIPVNLSYIYPFPMAIGEPMPIQFYLYPFLIVIICVCFWKMIKYRWIAFGILFFIINLTIVLHIIPLSRFTIIADRYAYISSIGVFFILAYILNYTYTRWVKYRLYTVTILVAYILFLGGQAYSRNQIWHNTATLKKDLKEIIEGRPDYKSLLKIYNSK